MQKGKQDMKSIDPTYEPDEQESESFSDGKHIVKSWDWFQGDAYRDSDGRPMVVMQKDGKMVGRLNFKLTDGKDGPPMSVTLQEMPLLVKAFGGNVTELPTIPELNRPVQVSKYMQVVQALCSEKETSIVVDNGWVNQLKGMEVPAGYFSFVLSDISPIDRKTGKVTVGVNKWGKPYIFANFKIVAGESGGASPFAGCSFSEYVAYAIVQDEKGEIDWERNDGDKQPTVPAARLNKLMTFTAPEDFTPGDDYPKVDEPEEYLHIWANNIDSRGKPIVLKGMRVQPEKPSTPKKDAKIYLNHTRLSWPSVELSDYEVAGVVSKSVNMLVELLDLLAGKSTVNKGTCDLNPAGVTEARKYISPLKENGKVTHGYLQELTDDEINHIFEYVKEQKVKPKEVAKLHDKFLTESLNLQTEPEETPF